MPHASRRFLAVALGVMLGLAACGGDPDAPSGGGTAAPEGEGGSLSVIADADPHTTLLRQVEEGGLLGATQLEIREIAGGVDPNQLVASGDVDVNFFQHTPYLKNWNADHSANLVSAAGVHLEPLGLYSKKVTNLAATPAGAVVAIPADATNLGRALFLLQDAGLITLNVQAGDPNVDIGQVQTSNVTGNPKRISFLEIERPQLAATLDDPKVDLSVINGNYALEAGLAPTEDSLHLEKVAGNPYTNVLVTRPELAQDPRVTRLAQALTSQQMKDFITTRYQGSVLPAEG